MANFLLKGLTKIVNEKHGLEFHKYEKEVIVYRGNNYLCTLTLNDLKSETFRKTVRKFLKENGYD